MLPGVLEILPEKLDDRGTEGDGEKDLRAYR
jgi:hypothetical protein